MPPARPSPLAADDSVVDAEVVDEGPAEENKCCRATRRTERVVITDKRRIDPRPGRRPRTERRATGRRPTAARTSPPVEPAEVPMVEATLLDERTADLQRLQAEYANYRKRADRDRLAAGEAAVGRVLTDLLPVLDDLDRARAHGDLTGA